MVQFLAPPNKFNELETLFNELTKSEAETHFGQVPDFIADPPGYLYIRGEYDFLCFETKWAPIIKEIQQIADYYQIGYTYEYDESMYVYSQANFIEGIFSDVYLDADDFELITYHEDKNGYLFEEEWWNSEEEILEVLFDRKK